MEAIDFRNANWHSIQPRLAGMTARVLAAWRTFGPQTTRGCWQNLCDPAIDLISFRARTTELKDIGFIVLHTEQRSNKQGVYRAVDEKQAKANFEKNKSIALAAQPVQGDFFGDSTISTKSTKGAFSQ